jgi:hypothetical protein
VKVLLTTQYDADLQSGLPHLVNYPKMLPLIGQEWKKSNNRILLVGESRYLPGETIPGKEIKSYGLINKSDIPAIVFKPGRENSKGFPTPPIKYDSQAALESIFWHYSDIGNFFSHMAYYNYVQPKTFVPAHIASQYKNESELSFKTLETITRILKPHKIIFISYGAFTSFKYQLNEQADIDVFYDVMIDYTCHPGSWRWYNNVKSYGNRSGHGKFLGILEGA